MWDNLKIEVTEDTHWSALKTCPEWRPPAHGQCSPPQLCRTLKTHKVKLPNFFESALLQSFSIRRHGQLSKSWNTASSNLRSVPRLPKTCQQRFQLLAWKALPTSPAMGPKKKPFTDRKSKAYQFSVWLGQADYFDRSGKVEYHNLIAASQFGPRKTLWYFSKLPALERRLVRFHVKPRHRILVVYLDVPR